jgi:diguanylate cyclase (GGDEF)-like protein
MVKFLGRGGQRVSGMTVAGRLISINLLFAVALFGVRAIAGHALDVQRNAAAHLGLLGTALRHHQHADMMHVRLREGANAALLASEIKETAGDALGALERDAQQFRSDLDSLGALDLTEELEANLNAVRSRAEIDIRQALEIGRLASVDRPAALAQLPELAKTFEEARLLMERQTQALSARIAVAERESADAAQRAKSWIIWAEVLVTIIGALYVAYVQHAIRKALRHVRDVAQSVADGQYDVRASLTSRDEMGQLSNAINRMAGNLQSTIERLQSEHDHELFHTQLVEALEMVDKEVEAHSIVARAMEAISPTHAMELLLADSSRGHLERAAQHPTQGAPGCTVDSPFGCVAVRRGNPIAFSDSEALNACAKLRNRPCGSVSAVCVPVGFMGRSLGVLHVAGPKGHMPNDEQVEQLSTLGIQAGARIGTVRAFERTQVQASTDSLTGLPNRRATEEFAQHLINTGGPYAVVMVDLDHFKRLNDTYGHEAGDKALVCFAEVARLVLREGDHVGRWGGEEFVFLMPKASADQVVAVVDRLRARLAETHRKPGAVVYTASFGIADSTMSKGFDDLVRIADDALYKAKEAGRDRAIIGRPQRREDDAEQAPAAPEADAPNVHRLAAER